MRKDEFERRLESISKNKIYAESRIEILKLIAEVLFDIHEKLDGNTPRRPT